MNSLQACETSIQCHITHELLHVEIVYTVVAIFCLCIFTKNYKDMFNYYYATATDIKKHLKLKMTII